MVARQRTGKNGTKTDGREFDLCCENPIFNSKQIVQCKGCRHASANVNHRTKVGWCGCHATHIADPAKLGAGLKMPPLLQRGKNLTRSSIDYAKSGFKNRSDKEKAECMAICDVCDDVVKRKTGLWCPHCGCCNSLATRWATKHCPIGKW